MSEQIKVTLPDNSVLNLDKGISAYEAAGKIGAGLQQNALAAEFNGSPIDLTATLTTDGVLKIYTFKDTEGKKVFWHSASHLLAQAVKHLYPEAKLAIGPAIDNGFYYDFDVPVTFTTDDFEKIEAEMVRIVEEKLEIKREVISKEEAIALFTKMGETYKVELINELADSTITIYRQGDFVDLCRGPHIRHTGYLKAVKLLSIAGAYWRGDEKNKMLQRIYAIAFTDRKELKAYLEMLEEIKKRDHRKLGRELDLFSMHDEAPGAPFFHSNGMVIYNLLVNFAREQNNRRGYQEVMTPIILNESLWHQSGHWDHYKENMYFTKIDDKDCAVKPMNCPGGLLVYKSHQYSYRALPLKVAEFGRVHRHEKSGVLHGLFRVRTFVQDDAHIFCTEDQIESEVRGVIEHILYTYNLFGFKEINIELSTKPDKAIGAPEIWEKAEGALAHALKASGIDYKINPGDGAFYGPKIDFHIKDSIGRSWQCGTVQLDFSMPQLFELTYTDSNGQDRTPVMLHRAIFGSVERFMGILIEHFAGKFPVWLAPIQVMVLNVSGEHAEYANTVQQKLQSVGLRSKCDLREDTVGYKIREAVNTKAPYVVVVGAKEAADSTVSVRMRGEQNSVTMSYADFEKMVKEAEVSKSIF